jgi:tetratricopeptide (TPR) repeat protein
LYCGNFQEAVEYGEIAFTRDSINPALHDLGTLITVHYFAGNYAESLKYVRKYFEKEKNASQQDYTIHSIHIWIGYVLWMNGYEEEANDFYDKVIEDLNRIIDLGRDYVETSNVYYDLACIYSFRKETDTTLDNLRLYKQQKLMGLGDVIGLQYDPLLNNIRDEPEFQQIVRDVEVKYQAEHERVRQWLEENEML